METNDNLAELDGALARVARRLAANTDPVDQAATRIQRLEREPWLRLLWIAGIIAASLAAQSYWIAVGLALAVVPRRIDGVRARRGEIDGLNDGADLLELERKSVTRRLRSACSRIVLFAAVALLYALLAVWASKPLGFIVAGSTLLASAAIGYAVFVPRLVRELRDLGGEPRRIWSESIVILGLFLAFPFVLLFGLVRSVLGSRASSEVEAGSDEEDAP